MNSAVDIKGNVEVFSTSHQRLMEDFDSYMAKRSARSRRYRTLYQAHVVVSRGREEFWLWGTRTRSRDCANRKLYALLADARRMLRVAGVA